jgi:hypothetical protein
MICTTLVPGVAWPEFTPRQPKEIFRRLVSEATKPRLPAYCADLYVSILNKPGITTKELAAIHEKSAQHTSRRLVLMLDDKLIRVVHVKRIGLNPLATFYISEVVCGMH